MRPKTSLGLYTIRQSTSIFSSSKTTERKCKLSYSFLEALHVE